VDAEAITQDSQPRKKSLEGTLKNFQAAFEEVAASGIISS
jgi:hypothetical protein